MNILHVEDTGNDAINVRLQRDNEFLMASETIQFQNPLTKKDRQEIRWYLEEYLHFPYGAEEDRAKIVTQRMDEIGEEIFRQVFTGEASGMDNSCSIYQTATREGLGACELCVTSDDTPFLGIPWELMKDPSIKNGYLAQSMKGFYRRLKNVHPESHPAIAENEPLRILLVISRPLENDVGLGTIARPVLEALRPIRHRVHLEVLRPPTFKELKKRLNSSDKHYHLIHFDGHGFYRHGGDGNLLFENDDHSRNYVTGELLGKVMRKKHVPLFVLNACQSADLDADDAFTSVASQLITAGVKGVVAMSYSVYAHTASKFMEKFYGSLADGKSFSQAVADARTGVYKNSLIRHNVVGDIDFRDWIVPSLYQSDYNYIPINISDRSDINTENAFLREVERVCPVGDFGFIGRHYDTQMIERAFQNNTYMLISGIGGIGKTEMAKGFARWYAETDGCPGGVFFISFEGGGSFAKIAGSVAGYGTDFSSLSDNEQYNIIVEYFLNNQCVLILDNFETVNGYPEGVEPLVSTEERDKIARFLRTINAGKSRVIITTRKPDEKWLEVEFIALKMLGLMPEEAAEMAEKALAKIDRAPKDFITDEHYAKLIKLLAGHPRSIEMVIPLLKTQTPQSVWDELQNQSDSDALEDKSLTVAFAHLSEKAKQHLPFIGLFTSYVVLCDIHLITTPGAKSSEIYEKIIGEAIDEDGWRAVLDEAARCGFVMPVDNKIYEIHPTIPVFLRRVLKKQIGDDGVSALNNEFTSIYADLGALFLYQANQSNKEAISMLTFEEANFLRALRLAIHNGKLAQAQAIIQTVNELYSTTKRYSEWTSLRDGIINDFSIDLANNINEDKNDLMIFILYNKANEAMQNSDIKKAEEIYHQIIALSNN